MLEVFREIEATGEELVVTSRGRPVLKVVPFERPEDVDRMFSDVRGRVRLPDDDELCAPVPEEAHADSDLAEFLR